MTQAGWSSSCALLWSLHGQIRTVLELPLPTFSCRRYSPAVVGNGVASLVDAFRCECSLSTELESSEARRSSSVHFCSDSVLLCVLSWWRGPCKSLPSLCLTCSSGDFPSSEPSILEMLQSVLLLSEQYQNVTIS